MKQTNKQTNKQTDKKREIDPEDNLIEYTEEAPGQIKMCIASLTSNQQYVWFSLYIYNGDADKKVYIYISKRINK